MKDSGIEWIGEIPEHWEVKQLKHIFEIKAGGDLKREYFSKKRTNEHLYPIYTNSTDKNFVYGYTSQKMFEGNTITVTGRGEVGFAIYREEPYDAIIRLLVLTPYDRNNCKYFVYFINSCLKFNVNKTAVQQLSTIQIAPYKVPSPSKEESAQITSYLDKKTSCIDETINKVKDENKLLREYRASLISNVVTGKIKVNNL